jgi:RNA polymerase sigma factor (sigma-70 family)
MARPEISELLARLSAGRGGDEERAFEELIRLLIILVRARLDARLRAQRESMDVCQSVARSFVEDWRAGRLRFENDAALAGYLQTVVRNKLTDLARHNLAARRGGGEALRAIDEADGISAGVIPAGGEGASTIVAGEELRARIEATLSPSERELIALRKRGLEWERIAERLGETPEALRKRWSRLQERIAEELRADK